MAEYVHSGDKIVASQYNALVDAIAGPTNATTDQPFTQTKNGVVINGGLGRQTTKAASTVPAMFEVSYGDGYVGAGYSTYSQGNIDANRFNGVFLNVGSWDTLAYNGFVLGNGVIVPTVPILAIIDPTDNNASIVLYNQALADTVVKGKLPLCAADKDAGYAFVQILDNGSSGKSRWGDFVLLVGDFTKLGGSSGSDIKTVSKISIITAIRGISLYQNCQDVRVVQGGVLWRHNVIAGVAGSNIPHLSYTVGTQYVDMLPDSYVNTNNQAEETVWANATMDVKLKSIAVVPPQQMGFTQLQSTNTFELYHFDKLSNDINRLGQISESELSSYDVLIKHKQPHPQAEDDPTYEGQAEADLEYIGLSCVVPPGDANANRRHTINTNLSSVSLAALDGHAFYQMYGFHENGTLGPSDLSNGGIEVVVRDSHSTGGNGARINYVDLSTITEGLSGGTSISGDYNIISNIQKSIDTIVSSGNKYHQLHGFDNPTYMDGNEFVGKENNVQIVLRDSFYGPKEVKYIKGKDFLSAVQIPGDAQIVPGPGKSINLLQQNSKKCYELYGWLGGDHSVLTVEIDCDGKTHYVEPQQNNHFLIEDHQTGTLKYRSLGIKVNPPELSDVGGGDDITNNITVISGDVHELSVRVEAIESQLSDYWVKGEDYQENYGSSIGNSGKSKVIDLDYRRLVGSWYTDHGDLNVDGDLLAGNVNATSTLKIGNTTLTEAQLQQLLALLNTP